ncbi:hypothetical protein VE02_05443 [Pseudogymnoascus sp. 03VT05]|nr:hypothetical protein VE02_05443 [Pseudogymnoascus sp. 03VT05]
MTSTNTTTPIPKSLLALTTPFTPPPNCANIFTTTRTLTSYHQNNFTTTTLTILYSDPNNAGFTQCQPPGWDSVVPESRFHFSPAVCPDQWTAYALRDLDVDIGSMMFFPFLVFTFPSFLPSLTFNKRPYRGGADNPRSGYTLNNPGVTLQSLNDLACISAIGVTPPLHHLHIHPLIRPRTPPISARHANPQRLPNNLGQHRQTHPLAHAAGLQLRMQRDAERVGAGGAGKGVGMVFIMVEIPVIVVVFVGMWCTYCYYSSKKKWRAEDEARRARNGGAGREAVVGQPG